MQKKKHADFLLLKSNSKAADRKWRPLEKRDITDSHRYEKQLQDLRAIIANHMQNRQSIKFKSAGSKEELTIQKLERLRQNAKEEPALTAILNNDVQSLANLFAIGLSPNHFLHCKNETAPLSLLSIASDLGNLEIVKVLLNWGAKPDAKINSKIETEKLDKSVESSTSTQEDDLEEVISNSDSSLSYAIRSEHVQIVKLLLEHKANPNKKLVDHATPLREACATGNGLIVLELLKAKANPNAASAKYGPLHIAAEWGNVAIFRLLLKFGAKVNLTLSKLGTPLDVARKYNQNEIIAIIEEEEAKLAAISASRYNAGDLIDSLKLCSKDLATALKQYENKNDEIKEIYDAIMSLLTQNNNRLKGAVYSTHKKNTERSCKSFKETNERREKDTENAWEKLLHNYDAFTKKHKAFVDIYGEKAPEIEELISDGELKSAKSMITELRKLLEDCLSHCKLLNDQDFVPILDGLKQQRKVIDECIVSNKPDSKPDSKPDNKKEDAVPKSIKNYDALKDKNRRYQRKMQKILRSEGAEAVSVPGISKLLSEDKKLHKIKKEERRIKLPPKPKRKMTDAVITKKERARLSESEPWVEHGIIELKGPDELQILQSKKQDKKRIQESSKNSGGDRDSIGSTRKPAIIYSQTKAVAVKPSGRFEPVTLSLLLQLDLKIALEDEVLLLEKLLTHYDIVGKTKSEHDEFAGAQALFGICARLMELLMQLQFGQHQSGFKAVPEALARKFRDVAAHGLNIFSNGQINPVDFETLKILASLILNFLKVEKRKAKTCTLKQLADIIQSVMMSDRFKPFMQYQIEQTPSVDECLKQIEKGAAVLVRIASLCDFTPIEIKVLAEWTTYGRLGAFSRHIKDRFRDIYRLNTALYDEYINKGIDFRHVKSSIQEKINSEIQKLEKPQKLVVKKFF